MFSYTATIGRNYSNSVAVPPSMRGQAMTLTRWHQFVEDVEADMASTYADLYLDGAERTFEVHYGKGVWEGVEEESAKITLLAEFELDERGLSTLRRLLSENARFYDQDAIALTVGDSELCTSTWSLRPGR